MKAPKIKKYADGGKVPTRYAEKRMTPAEWEAYAAEKKWEQYPGSDINSRGYKSYYDTTKYKFNIDPATGKVDSRSSVALEEGIAPTAQTIEYDYVNPKLTEKTPQRSFPGVDPNYKPLVIGTAGTYDPNTGVNYVDPSKQTGTNPPVVQQYSSGGKIKAPSLKKKVAKYYDGTGPDGVQKDQYGNPISGQNQLNAGGTEFTASGDSNFYQGYQKGSMGADTTQKKQGNGQFANQAAGGLGSYGKGYYANQQPQNEGEDTRGKALSAAGNMGAIGGVIAGAAAIGDQIGKPIRERSEKMDAQGNLVDEDKAKRNAAIGIMFSPSKRLTYKGGMTDITGEKYVKSLEEAKKEEINQQGVSEAMDKRAAGETMVSSNTVNYDKPEKKKWWQLKAEGGTIKGKGGPKSDSIMSKVDEKGIPAGSFITPAENNGLAKSIRANILGENPNKTAQFKKLSEGGEAEDADVAVSNGEHLFTPKEKKKIINYLGEEILEELAPNAEDESEDKNCGGNVKKYKDGTDPKGVSKRKNSTGVKGADRLIDDAYANPPKTEEEYNSLINKLKVLTKGAVNKEVNDFINWSNPKRSKARLESESKFEENKRLVEYGPDITKNIKKLKDLGAPDDIIKKYTNDASAVGKKQQGLARSKTPDELFNVYKDRVEDEDFKANKENVKKGLDARVQANYKKLEEVKNNPENYTAEQIQKAQDDFDSAAAYRNKLNEDIDKNDLKSYREAKDILSKSGTTFKSENSKGTAPVKSGAKLDELKQDPADKLGKNKWEMPTNLKDRGRGISAPSVKGVSKKSGLEFVPKIAEDNVDYPVVPGTETQGKPVTEAIDPRFKQQKPLSDAAADLLVTSAKKQSDSYVPPKEKENFNIGQAMEYGIPLAQTIYGMSALKKAGKRPVDQMDKDFNASVEKAKQQAAFGYTPEEKAYLDNQNQNLTNAARFTGRNLSGGSAAVAQANERAAINQAYSRGLETLIKGKQLQMDKQAYADSLIQAKQEKSRQLFQDNLSGWKENQIAGGNLVGSGIQNYIGALRYNKTVEAMKDADKERNSYRYIDYSKLAG